MSGDNKSYNTPVSDTVTLGQRTGDLGFVITENVQTTQPDGSVVTRDYSATGQGPVTSDTGKK